MKVPHHQKKTWTFSESHTHFFKFIAVAMIQTNESSSTLFDVAEMWMFYSPTSAVSVARCRQALLGDDDYGMAQDINTQNYPSFFGPT